MSLLEPIEDFHLQLIGCPDATGSLICFAWAGWAKCKKSLSLNSDLAILTIANAMISRCQFHSIAKNTDPLSQQTTKQTNIEQIL